jgi:glycosyltransferase involved in cell wall biosynthesis
MRSSSSRGLRVLLIAEACNPAWSSVPLVGYRLYRALSRRLDVTLVTQIRNRTELLAQLGADSRIVFIDSERLAGPCHRIGNLLTLGRGVGWTTRQCLMWLPYLYFEYLTYRRLRRELAARAFDIVHRVTPLSPTYPSPLASWTRVPFVLGPLNGGLPWPAAWRHARIAEMEWLSYVRNFYRLLPYVTRTYERAACVIAGSRYTLLALPRVIRQRAVYLPENGIDPGRFTDAGRVPPSRVTPFKILFVGRLVPYKGADMVLAAYAGSAELRAHARVEIVGEGPQRAELSRFVRYHNLQSHVGFTGNLPQAEVARHFRESSVFAFPSVREFGGGVIMEAMACGLPCVVVDYGGPGEYVTPDTGVKLRIRCREALIADLRDALIALWREPQRLDKMSARSAERARCAFTWDEKARVIEELYRTRCAAGDRA